MYFLIFFLFAIVVNATPPNAILWIKYNVVGSSSNPCVTRYGCTSPAKAVRATSEYNVSSMFTLETRMWNEKTPLNLTWGNITVDFVNTGLDSSYVWGGFNSTLTTTVTCSNWTNSSEIGAIFRTSNFNSTTTIDCDDTIGVLCSCLSTNPYELDAILPVETYPIVDFSNMSIAPKACPTACPIEYFDGNVVMFESTQLNSTTHVFPNSTGDSYPNGTQLLTPSILYSNNTPCFYQPNYGYFTLLMESLPCSEIKRINLNKILLFGISNLVHLNETSANNLTLVYLVLLQTMEVTVYSNLYLFVLPALETITFGEDTTMTSVDFSYVGPLGYFNFTRNKLTRAHFFSAGLLMNIALNATSHLHLEDVPAFERLDFITPPSSDAVLYINTRSERFLNSRPLCKGNFTGNVTFFNDNCLPVDDAPPRISGDCVRPMTTKCTSSLVYDEDCWIPQWSVDNFTILSFGVIKDCVFDVNHWFDVDKLYVMNPDAELPPRIRATTIFYINTTSPTNFPSVNPSKNPSKNPSQNPTKNPTKSPTRQPSKNPTGVCSPGNCNQFECGCVKSENGVRCTECNHAGYLLATGKCKCYGRLLNANKNCLPYDGELTDRRIRRRLTTATLTKTKVNCNCHYDSFNGFFKPISNTKHKFGSPNPPVCDSCITENYGPLPGTIPVGSKTKACTEWGGPDVNFLPNDASWRTCGGHGTWIGNACRCWKGWTLGARIVGKTSDEIIKICNTCNDNFGPFPGSDNAPYCNKVMTINPLTKMREECGGGGFYIEGNCQCVSGYVSSLVENVHTCLKI